MDAPTDTPAEPAPARPQMALRKVEAKLPRRRKASKAFVETLRGKEVTAFYIS